MDYNTMSLSQIEKVIARTRSKAIRVLSQLDKMTSLLASKPNGKTNGHGRIKIHSIEAVNKKKKSKKATGNRALQGKYLGAVRWLTVKQRAEIKRVKDEKGFHAALKAAKIMKNMTKGAAQ